MGVYNNRSILFRLGHVYSLSPYNSQSRILSPVAYLVNVFFCIDAKVHRGVIATEAVAPSANLRAGYGQLIKRDMSKLIFRSLHWDTTAQTVTLSEPNTRI
jgi:hypothetical protein